MATREAYEEVIGGLDAVQGVAEKINEYAEAARDLDKAAKSAVKAGETAEKLSQAQDLMKNVEAFGKLASGLGMASMGLGLALSVFGPEPEDPTELILGAIDNLDKKTDGLWDSMDRKFDEVLGKIDQVAADIMISEELENFAALHDVVSRYIKNKSKSNIQTLLDPLYDPDGIYDDLVKIAGYLKPDSDNNPLEKTYNATNGDLRAVMRHGNKFQKITQLAPMAYGLISALHFEKSGPDDPYVLDSAADIEDKFKEHIVNINATVDFYIEKCRKELIPNSEADAKSMMKDLKTTGDWHEGSNYRQAAKDLWEKLAPKYFWLDWFVIVGCGDIFEGKLGTYREQPNDNERGSHFFNNEKCNKTTETMTILIGWRSQDIKIPPYTSQKQLDYNVLFKSPDRAQMFLNGSMGPARETGVKGMNVSDIIKKVNVREIIKNRDGKGFSIEYKPGGSKMNTPVGVSPDQAQAFGGNYHTRTINGYSCNAPNGSLAWLCRDRVPFSAYWNPENNINVIVACSHPQMFPTEVMDGLRKVNNLKMVDHISWLWFY